MTKSNVRYIKAKPWFGAVENKVDVKFDATELEAVVRKWLQKPVDSKV